MSDRDPEAVEREPADATPGNGERVRELRAQIDLLRAENERLRNEYARARRTSYRRTALGLAGVGAVAVLAGVLFPAARQVLFVLGAIGLFGGILTRYLTPARFVAAETGERVYAAQADTLDALTDQLGLSNHRLYVPVTGDPPAKLFLPQHAEYELPDGDALEGPLVVDVPDAQRGASLVPTGGTLFREFERSLASPLGDDPVTVVEQVADALVERFELVETADVSVDETEGQATLAMDGAVYDDAGTVDNPLGSLLAVALVAALDTPVSLETARSDEALVVTARWDAATGSDD